MVRYEVGWPKRKSEPTAILSRIQELGPPKTAASVATARSG